MTGLHIVPKEKFVNYSAIMHVVGMLGKLANGEITSVAWCALDEKGSVNDIGWSAKDTAAPHLYLGVSALNEHMLKDMTG